MRKGALTRTSGTFKRVLWEPFYREINWLSQAQRMAMTGLFPMQRLHCTSLVKFRDADICSTHGPGVDDELAASCRLPSCSRAWRVSTGKHPGESLAEGERLA